MTLTCASATADGQDQCVMVGCPFHQTHANGRKKRSVTARVYGATPLTHAHHSTAVSTCVSAWSATVIVSERGGGGGDDDNVHSLVHSLTRFPLPLPLVVNILTAVPGCLEN